MRRISWAVALAVLILSACNRANVSSSWDDFIKAHLESSFAANPNFAVYVGRHDFDGKLPDWSKTGIQKEIQRLHAERAKAQAFDAKTLDERQQFERDYVIAVLDGQLFWLETAEWPFK